MQSTPISNKPLGVLVLLLAMTALLLYLSIHTYNKTLFIGAKDTQAEMAASKIDIIPISVHDPVLGNPSAPLTIIGFEDFLCESCRRQHTLISELLDTYPDQVKFIWKDLPIITIPSSSEMIHVYGYCMNEQNMFDTYKDLIFSNIITSVTPSLLDTIATQSGADMATLQACVNSEAPYTHLDKNKQLARALQIQNTPTFFVQGTQVRTPASVFEWKTLLQLKD